MLVVTEPSSYTGEAYSGELKIDRLTKFLNQYSYKTATYEKKIDFVQLTGAKFKQQSLCGKRSSNICFIFFTTSEVSELLKNQLKPLLDFYKNDPLSLVWVDKHEEEGLHQ